MTSTGRYREEGQEQNPAPDLAQHLAMADVHHVHQRARVGEHSGELGEYKGQEQHR
jgi:hypothetical protein